MSHDRGRRAACGMTIWILRFHFEIREIARGVTAMVVGSGALLGLFSPHVGSELLHANASNHFVRKAVDEPNVGEPRPLLAGNVIIATGLKVGDEHANACAVVVTAHHIDLVAAGIDAHVALRERLHHRIPLGTQIDVSDDNAIESTVQRSERALARRECGRKLDRRAATTAQQKRNGKNEPRFHLFAQRQRWATTVAGAPRAAWRFGFCGFIGKLLR